MGDTYKDKIVIKPWGYEYLVYENDEVALWCLHINQGESTSMHCHPKKTTGLVLLNGEAEVSFLSDKRIIKGLDKVMIRRGLFHQTKALSEGGVDLFEIETPNDKEDLVRLYDNYGRQDKPYETNYRHKNKDCFTIDSWMDKEWIGLKIKVHLILNKDYISTINDDEIIVFLKGGLKRDINGKELCALIPGDVGFANIVKKVALNLDGVIDKTIIMRISKNG